MFPALERRRRRKQWRDINHKDRKHRLEAAQLLQRHGTYRACVRGEGYINPPVRRHLELLSKASPAEILEMAKFQTCWLRKHDPTRGKRHRRYWSASPVWRKRVASRQHALAWAWVDVAAAALPQQPRDSIQPPTP